jgi:hypothetical protein
MWKALFVLLSIRVVTEGTQQILVKFGIGGPHYDLLRLHYRNVKILIPVGNVFFVAVIDTPKRDMIHTTAMY